MSFQNQYLLACLQVPYPCRFVITPGDNPRSIRRDGNRRDEKGVSAHRHQLPSGLRFPYRHFTRLPLFSTASDNPLAIGSDGSARDRIRTPVNTYNLSLHTLLNIRVVEQRSIFCMILGFYWLNVAETVPIAPLETSEGAVLLLIYLIQNLIDAIKPFCSGMRQE